MEEQGRLRVTLELDRRTDDPISGRIGVGDDVREFSGWLRLIAVLEDARQPKDGGRSPPPHLNHSRLQSTATKSKSKE